jgi:hypothetical protein
MVDDNKILEAVQQLDKDNDTHWTADGLPRLETLRSLTSDSSLTREQVEAAAPGSKRPKDEAGATPPAPPAAPAAPDAPAAPPAEPTPTPPAAPPGTPPVPPTPTVSEPPAGSVDQPEQDSGVRGDIGLATPAADVPVAAIEGAGGPVLPEDVEGNKLPQPEPRSTAPAADGLPTEREPTRLEGAPSIGLTVDEVSGRSGPGGKPIPELAKGATGTGSNQLATPKSDLVDALASVAPSPNAPTGLGGPLEPGDMAGINADGLRSTADATGETELPSLDRGYAGDPDAIPALQEELAASEAKTAKLKAQSDKLTGELNEAAANESRLRAAIEAATPRSGQMEAIQGFFGAQDRRAEDVAMTRQQILESGVDLKALGRLTQRSPLDASKQPQDR